MIITLWFVLSVTFTAMSFIPGNPYPNQEKLTKEQIELYDKQYGFDRPLVTQYFDYITGIIGLQGLITIEGAPEETFLGYDFGYSFSTKGDVDKVLVKAFPYSFTLGFASVFVGTIIGVFLGVIASIKKDGPLDMMATVISVMGVSFPSFVFASYLQMFFAGKPLFIFFGPQIPTMFSNGNWVSFILPVAALSVFAIAQTARVTRTEMVEVLGSNFITLGKAKGVVRKKIILNYAFRNSLIAILTVLGPLMVALTTGSLVIEKIFSIPGMGEHLNTAIIKNDIFMVLGATQLIAIQILVMYLIVDILYAFVDPRIRIVGGSK